MEIDERKYEKGKEWEFALGAKSPGGREGALC